ncbi:MAG: AAA family ATPase [Spirochaetales bacterium]|nr:AAA family ATPase [Spirochaetales bacterium]
MRKNGVLRFVLLALIIALIAVLALDSTGIIDLDDMFSASRKSNYVQYAVLSDAINSGSVTEAVIEPQSVRFSTSAGTFVTDNPDSSDLKERLLQSGAKVNVKSGVSVTAVLDVIFDVLFFGAVAFGIFKLIDYSRKTFKVVHGTGVHFEDIAGMDGVKKDMMFLVDVLKNPGKYSRSGLRQVKGVILEGPPGNGKTLFAKALAQETDVNFIATKGADFQSAMMSMGARKIRMLFSKASRRKPCIIFIDEFDSIGERRNYAGTGIDKENNRIITTMLNEMDGFSPNNGLMVIAATNSYASLDPALIRPGRFDLKYTIGNPDAQTRAKLIEIYCKGKSISSDLDLQALAFAFDGLSCAAIETILNEAQAICQQHGGSITMDHILAAAQKTGSKLNIKTKR